ncbi:hypothetical protein AB0A74_22620 [Saccharothrix sp. NPDC042600]|uniref:hypothetical protein n=1 Tax=Saccharothrix TaxID=2071 RepID=UPI0033E14501
MPDQFEGVVIERSIRVPMPLNIDDQDSSLVRPDRHRFPQDLQDPLRGFLEVFLHAHVVEDEHSLLVVGGSLGALALPVGQGPMTPSSGRSPKTGCCFDHGRRAPRDHPDSASRRL